MKKIIALALALIMALSMASVAFAAAAPCAEELQAGKCEVEIEGTAHLLPGEKYLIMMDEAKDLKLTAEWSKGGALVKGISYDKKAVADDFDDAHTLVEPTLTNNFDSTAETDDEAGAWVLELNENFTITTAKALEGKLVVTGKVDGEKETEKVAVAYEVSNHVVTLQGEEDLEDVVTYEADNNTLYICEEDAPGYVIFNTQALLGVTLNMVGEEKAFMYNDEKAIEALTEKFPEADIECYNFGGEPTFKNAAAFTLQADYADQYYVYTYVDGKLEAQDYEWDSIEGVYTWETKSPASYVISDVELVAAEEETKNPDTGANDVVGVAAALAVVSLVAAGAVSLKK